MTEILFYHLTESKLEDALPPLLDKSIERGWRVVVQTIDAERRDALDTHLWVYRDDSFLPHGTDAGEFAAEQPILVVADDGNRNAATVRFVVAAPSRRRFPNMSGLFSCSTATTSNSSRRRAISGSGSRARGTISPIGSRTVTEGGKRRRDRSSIDGL